MLNEQNQLEYDEFYVDDRYGGGPKRFRARFGTVFDEHEIKHSPDYKQCTVHKYPPLLAALREKLAEFLGPKGQGLNAEANLYHKLQGGIGFHGDAERKRVVCASLGDPATLRFYWHAPGRTKVGTTGVYRGKLFDFRIEGSDIYIMSERATGWNYQSSSGYRLVHAAGSDKYITPQVKKEKKTPKKKASKKEKPSHKAT